MWKFENFQSHLWKRKKWKVHFFLLLVLSILKIYSRLNYTYEMNIFTQIKALDIIHVEESIQI